MTGFFARMADRATGREAPLVARVPQPFQAAGVEELEVLEVTAPASGTPPVAEADAPPARPAPPVARPDAAEPNAGPAPRPEQRDEPAAAPPRATLPHEPEPSREPEPSPVPPPAAVTRPPVADAGAPVAIAPPPRPLPTADVAEPTAPLPPPALAVRAAAPPSAAPAPRRRHRAPPPSVPPDLATLLREHVLPALAERGVVPRDESAVIVPEGRRAAPRPGTVAMQAGLPVPRPVPHAPRSSAEPTDPAPEPPQVHLHIDRVVVTRAAAPPAPVAAPTPAAPPRSSVDHDAYLARRRAQG